MISALKEFLTDGMKQFDVAGVAFSLIDRGKVVYEGGLGFKELGKPDPVDANTLFMAASNTKAMTTLLLAELVDEKKLRWDQPVTEIYPAFAEALKGDVAQPHGDDVDGKPARARIDADECIVPFRPAGGAWTSAHDLSKYVQMELAKGALPGGRRLVSEENLLARRDRQVLVSEDITYGMGLFVDRRWGIPIVHHGGDLFGYHSDMMWLPKHGVGAVILTNSDSGVSLRGPFLRRLVELLFNGKRSAS
jgi:CubicO group peptidase (beta-lactamase class C family)